jgi:hypothetical protein
MMFQSVPQAAVGVMRVAACTFALMMSAAPTQAGERDQLNACKAMVAKADKAGAPPQDDAALQRCRLVIKDWTLRDSRMSVDEDGRPLR